MKKKTWEEEYAFRKGMAQIFTTTARSYIDVFITKGIKDEITCALKDKFIEYDQSLGWYMYELPDIVARLDKVDPRKLLFEPYNEAGKWVMALATALGGGEIFNGNRGRNA